VDRLYSTILQKKLELSWESPKSLFPIILDVRFNRAVDTLESSFAVQSRENGNTNATTNNDPLCVIDTITIDSQCRFTLTKKFREMLSVRPIPGDVMAIFQNPYTNSIVMKLQRNNQVLGVWEVRSIA
jgi:hypothetical protein